VEERETTEKKQGGTLIHATDVYAKTALQSLQIFKPSMFDSATPMMTIEKMKMMTPVPTF
jgi:hypothetical protein